MFPLNLLVTSSSSHLWLPTTWEGKPLGNQGPCLLLVCMDGAGPGVQTGPSEVQGVNIGCQRAVAGQVKPEEWSCAAHDL